MARAKAATAKDAGAKAPRERRARAHASLAAVAVQRAEYLKGLAHALFRAVKGRKDGPSEAKWNESLRLAGFTTEAGTVRGGGAVLVDAARIEGTGKRLAEVWIPADSNETVKVAERMLAGIALGIEGVGAVTGQDGRARTRALKRLRAWGMADGRTASEVKRIDHAVFGDSLREDVERECRDAGIPETHPFGYITRKDGRKRKRFGLRYRCAGFQEGSPCYGKEGRLTLRVQGGEDAEDALDLAKLVIPCKAHGTKKAEPDHVNAEERKR